jgi:hypothetical protein
MPRRHLRQLFPTVVGDLCNEHWRDEAASVTTSLVTRLWLIQWSCPRYDSGGPSGDRPVCRHRFGNSMPWNRNIRFTPAAFTLRYKRPATCGGHPLGHSVAKRSCRGGPRGNCALRRV